jgi:hypothetical protein
MRSLSLAIKAADPERAKVPVSLPFRLTDKLPHIHECMPEKPKFESLSSTIQSWQTALVPGFEGTVVISMTTLFPRPRKSKILQRLAAAVVGLPSPSTLSAAHWPHVRPKVSGRKFPFSESLFLGVHRARPLGVSNLDTWSLVRRRLQASGNRAAMNERHP